MVMLSHINMPDAGSPTGKIEVLHFPPKKKKKVPEIMHQTFS